MARPDHHYVNHSKASPESNLQHFYRILLHEGSVLAWWPSLPSGLGPQRRGLKNHVVSSVVSLRYFRALTALVPFPTPTNLISQRVDYLLGVPDLSHRVSDLAPPKKRHFFSGDRT